MRIIEYLPPIGGQVNYHYQINVVENLLDMATVVEFLRNHPVVALDTETTGLDIYAAEHKLRLIQFGVDRASYVIPYRPEWTLMLREMLQIPETLIIHNAPYDTQVLARHVGIDLSVLWSKVADTRIWSHLIDSRSRKDGGSGHSLEELVSKYLSPEVAEDCKGMIARKCRELKLTRSRYFAEVPIDDEDYLRYAGMDPILTYLLYQVVKGLVPDESRHLISREHELSELATSISHRGWVLDTSRTQLFGMELDEAGLEADDTAWDWYLDNVDSPKQVIQALEYAGITLDGRTTPGGQPKVDGKFLKKISHPLTDAIVASKRATKWRSAYVDNFLDNVDPAGRIHPVINTLAARTARFSVQNPAVQTLPSKDPRVKDCLLADYDERTLAVDYDSQELRLAAALSGDRKMIQAFLDGVDLHQITAEAANVSRDVGKMANYLTVYGGGWRALVEQGGVDEETARRVIHAIKVTYPDLEEFARDTAREVRSRGYVTTPLGRRLYVDPDRAYSGINYKLQSAGRDITVGAMLRLPKHYQNRLRMAVHDELVFSIDKHYPKRTAQDLMEIMTDQVGPVPLTVEAKLGQRSWGSLYREGQYEKLVLTPS